MSFRSLSAEVRVACDPVVRLSSSEVSEIAAAAAVSSRHQCRILLHQNASDALHEMVIVHEQGRYIRPHRNCRSSKSYHVVEGRMVCVIFSDSGEVRETIELGDYRSGGVFVVRMSDSLYHTLLPLTKQVVFVETILGPFTGTMYAPWAPQEDGSDEARDYFRSLTGLIGKRSIQGDGE